MSGMKPMNSDMMEALDTIERDHVTGRESLQHRLGHLTRSYTGSPFAVACVLPVREELPTKCAD